MLRGVLFVFAAIALIAGVGIGGPASASHSSQHPCDLVASTEGIDAPDRGDDASEPLRLVQTLVDRLQPGQTGCLRGTEAAVPFSENVVISNKNPSGGSESNRITLMSYPGEVAKIRGRVRIEESANFVSLAKLVLEGTPGGAVARLDGDDLRLTDSNITNSNGACVAVGTAAANPNTDPRAERAGLLRNRIHDCEADAIELVRTRHTNVQANLVYDNGDYGVRFQPEGDASFVFRNIFDRNAHGVGFFGDGTSRFADLNFLNRNIISRSTIGWNIGYEQMAGPAGNMVTQTCVFSPTESNGGLQTAPVLQGYRIWAPPLPISDPGYVDRDAGDFHPASASDPCFAPTGDVAALVDAGGGPNDEQATADNPLPNILFVVTDDQRDHGTVTQEVMPHTVDELERAGVRFSNAYAASPICCPARASIMTGQYPHNHDVTTSVRGEYMLQQNSLQAYLKQHGDHPYRTAMFGKFLNRWNLEKDPPFWDEWSVLNDSYCPFLVNEDGDRKRYPPLNPATGGPPAGECSPSQVGVEGQEAIAPYVTDYVGNRALDFLAQGEADDETDSQPWFLYVAPTAPHGPQLPEAQYANTTFSPFEETPATFEDTSDKPPWIGQSVTTPTAIFGDPNANPPTPGVRVQQLRTLRSVDDMVGTLLDDLQRKGEQDTLVVFIGDNGYHWGEHGLTEKGSPYLDSAKVPMLMRYAPLTVPGNVDSRPVANIDLMPTALEVAEVPAPSDPPPDGQSLVGATTPRSRLHTEFYRHGGDADWAATRAPDDYLYIEHYANDGETVQFREYYDLAADPYELTNLYGPDGQPDEPGEPDPDDLGVPDQPVETLHDMLRRDRLCEGTACTPGPGGGTQDTRPPRTLVTAPALNSTVCCRVMLKADATDNIWVDHVEFRVDGNLVGTDSAAPYRVIWEDTNLYAPGVHTVEAIAFDAQGNETPGGSPGSVIGINLDGNGFDVQIDDGGVPREGAACGNAPSPCNVGTVNPGDQVKLTFPSPPDPNAIIPGWTGTEPVACTGTPLPLGCVTVGITADSRVDQEDADVLGVYDPGVGTNPLTAVPLPELGTVDLGEFSYVGFDTGIPFRTWPQSKMSVSGNTVTVTLGEGTGAPNGGPRATAKWRNPSCNCQVWESIDGAETLEDREF